MRNITPIEAIQQTATYKRLLEKKDKAKIYTLEKRTTRGDIANAVQIFRNTGAIPIHFTGIELQVIIDLIEIPNTKEVDVNNIEVDYSHVMTCENLNTDKHEK